ncbi:hypothetical protein CBL_11871 [Carabus blaptoides fortunei]
MDLNIENMEKNNIVNEEGDTLTPRRKETIKLKRKIFDSLKKLSLKRSKPSAKSSKSENELHIKDNDTNFAETSKSFVLHSLDVQKNIIMLDSSNLSSLSLSVKRKTNEPSSLPFETDIGEPKCYEGMDYLRHECKLNIDDINGYKDEDLKQRVDAPPSPTIKELLDLAAYLKQSEANMKQMISKYIQDDNAVKELVQTISDHIDLKIQNEKQAYAFSKEMFLKQTEINKAKELSLQDSINVLVSINKSMQNEIDLLQKENETLMASGKTESENVYSEKQEDDNHLHDKLLMALKKFKNLERELNVVKSENQSLHNQLTEANNQIDKYKVLLDKTIAEFELKCESLFKQLQSNQQEIKDCLEAGDMLSNDMNSLATQLRSSSISQNWPNLEWCGSNVVDLIHLSRTCMNKLAKELFNSNNQINILNKENEQMKKEKSDKLYFALCEQCNILKSESMIQKDTMKKENERSLKLTNDFANLKSQITNKENAISKLESDLQMCFTENQQLKNRLDYLQVILKASELYNELQLPNTKSNYCQKCEQLKKTINARCTSEDKEVSCQLNDTASLDEQWKDKFVAEKHKVKQISATKTILEEQYNINLQELHQMLRDEREAMRELLKDHKHVTNQRNGLLSLNTEYLAQIEQLKSNVTELQVLNEQLEVKYNNLELQYAELTNELEQARKTVDIELITNENKVSEYERKICERDNIIEKFKCEREEMQNSIRYLQCTTKKLHNELNTLRSSEKDNKKKMASASESFVKFLNKIEQQELILRQSISEKKLLEEKLNVTETKYNTLLMEYNGKKALLEEHEKRYEQLKERLSEFEQVSTTLIEKSTLLEESLRNQQQLEYKLSAIVEEHSHCLQRANELTNHINNLNKELDEVKNKRDNEFESCSHIVDNLIIENQQKQKDLTNGLNIATNKLNNMNKKYAMQSRKLQYAKGKYKQLLQTMNIVVNLATEENLLTRNIETTIANIKQDVRIVSIKLKSVSICVVQLISAAIPIEQKIEQFLERETEMQDMLNSTRKICLEGKQECENMRWNLELSREKLKKMEELPFIELDHIHQEMDLKDELIRKTEEQLYTLQDRLLHIKEQVLRKNTVILQLKAEISVANQKIQTIEFQKCELTLRLHETNCKLSAEQHLNISLKESHQHLLESICKINLDHPKAQPLKCLLGISDTENCVETE